MAKGKIIPSVVPVDMGGGGDEKDAVLLYDGERRCYYRTSMSLVLSMVRKEYEDELAEIKAEYEKELAELKKEQREFIEETSKNNETILKALKERL